MDVYEKIDALMHYRNALDEDDKEVFDILVNSAKEVALLQV